MFAWKGFWLAEQIRKTLLPAPAATKHKDLHSVTEGKLRIHKKKLKAMFILKSILLSKTCLQYLKYDISITDDPCR